MKALKAAVAATALLMLAGCWQGSDKVADQVQEGVAQTCDFLVDYQWIRDVVSKMDVTLATVNGAVTAICQGVLQSKASAMASLFVPVQDEDCPHGSIVVDGKKVCIEGEPLDE